MSEPIDDRIDITTAFELLGGGKPMATCPRCGDPLVGTFEFAGAEFICVECDQLYGFLSPTPAPVTPELTARYDELVARYDVARAARAAGGE